LKERRVFLYTAPTSWRRIKGRKKKVKRKPKGVLYSEKDRNGTKLIASGGKNGKETIK
jgi:hypothetical protein